MAKINFNVEDQLSGNNGSVLDVEDTLTVGHFLAELSQHGFGPFAAVESHADIDLIVRLVVDGKSYPWTTELEIKQLAEIGVVEGCILSIEPYIFV
tara:strand:+ start:4675 stop:4962 length:288 start_codon:yes stop_codon:yes gene_type:complete